MPEHPLMAIKGTEDVLTLTAEANDKTGGFVAQFKHTEAGFLHRMDKTQAEVDALEFGPTERPLTDEEAIRKYTKWDNLKNNLDSMTGLEEKGKAGVEYPT